MEHNASLKETAKIFGVNKTTIRIDVTKRLDDSYPIKAEVLRILSENEKTACKKGGEASRRKYATFGGAKETQQSINNVKKQRKTK